MKQHYVIEFDQQGEILTFFISGVEPMEPRGDNQIALTTTVPVNAKTSWVKNGKLERRHPPPSRFYKWQNEEWVYSNKKLMNYIRYERDNRLKETDWRALPDVPNRSEWLEYRQKLRDFPSKVGTPETPEEIIWPREPTT